MKGILRSLFVVGVAGLVAASAFAGATVLKDLPIGGTLAPNECTGEALFLTGIAHIVLHNGDIHIKVDDVSAEGVDTGRLWTSKSVSVQKSTTSSDENGAVSTTYVFRIRLESGEDAFQAKITSHTTVNANGDVTSDFEFATVDCK